MTKAVSFSESHENDVMDPVKNNFKTWPRSSMRDLMPSSAVDDSEKEAKSSQDDMNKVVDDIYHRFRGLSGVDVHLCLKHLLTGKCHDQLKTYSVLNMLLKDMEELNGSSDISLEPEEMRQILERSIIDFDNATDSGNVRDTWTLQQIMRSIEQIWARSPRSEDAAAVDAFTELARRCVALIDEKSGSKTLLSPAIRIVNIAFDRNLLPISAVIDLINALSRSHFLFASSFITEAMLILSTAHRVNVDALNETESAWVPLAVRALGSSSSLTRSLAVQLIQYHATTLPMPDSPGLLASCLMQPSEPHKANSEPLYRVMVRKMASISAFSFEDAKLMVQAWTAVVQSAFYTGKEWPLLNVWQDIVRVAFSKWPKTIPLAWDIIEKAQSVHSSYNCALVAPIVAMQYSDDSQNEMCQMIVDGVSAASQGFTKSQADNALELSSMTSSSPSNFASEIWDVVLEPVFKSLASSRSNTALISWAQLIDKNAWVMTAADLPKYLEILALLFKHNLQQSQTQTSSPSKSQSQSQAANDQHISFSSYEAIWMKCIEIGASSRQKVMDLVKFHYTLLSQFTSNHNLALMFTNRLIAHLPAHILTEKPKNSSFEYLTLILLPVVTFMNDQNDYMDRVLSSCKSEKTMRIMLRALLATVETGSDSQNNNKASKWALSARIIRDYVGTHTDQETTHLIGDAVLMFVPLMNKATPKLWQLWGSLLIGNRDCQSRVLTQLKKLPPQGLQIILSLPRATFKDEKVKLVKSSFNEAVLTMLLTQSETPLLDTEMLDSVARYLVSQNKSDSCQWAVKLLGTSRRFVLAKPLLQAIESTKNEDLVRLWNNQVEPYLKSCPPFVEKNHAVRLNQDLPQLQIGYELVIKPSAAKRPLETPPQSSNAKRPRRPILTGSVRTNLFTPPASSDTADEMSPSRKRSLGDDLCSSPPPRAGSPSIGMSLPQTWKNSQDRARTLKRLMMGFDMEEASQTMKRSEMQMIYNLMFKSCVWLKTHLAETGSIIPEEEVANARVDLEKTIELRKALQTREDIMIENGKRRERELMNGSQDFSDEDEIPSDELDSEDFEPVNEIKMEVI